MKNKNLPVKTFNYGKKDYILYRSIENIAYNKKYERLFKKKSLPFQLEINKNKELIKIFDEYYYLFFKFAERKKETYKINNFKYLVNKEELENELFKFGQVYNVDKKIKGYIFDVTFYKIKQSLLSYVIQNKINLYNKFNKIVEIKRKKYLLENMFEELKQQNLNSHYYKNNFLKIENKEVSVWNLQKNKEEKVCLTIKKDVFYINKEKYIFKIYNNYKDIILYEMIEKTINEYEQFKSLLFEFFEKVNTQNNDDWDSYLTNEVKKLMSMDFHKELEKMREGVK